VPTTNRNLKESSMRSFFCGLFALVVCVVAFGKDYDGTVTKVDGDKVTFMVEPAEKDGKAVEKTFILTEDTKYQGGKNATKETLTKRLEKNKEGVKATISSEEKDGKETTKDSALIATKVAMKKKGA
jgi:hypothetical protein